MIYKSYERVLAIVFVLSVIVVFFVDVSGALKLLAGIILAAAPLMIMLGRFLAFILTDRQKE